jgi:zinc protease
MLALAGCAASDPLTPHPVASGAGAPESFRLPNGMEVLVIPDHRAPIVTHMVWYRLGSAEETPGKTGLAHFLEHLMFKGTAKIPPGQFSRIVARNGGRDNAFTNYDFTAYYQSIAKDRLSLVMEMEADRMTGLKLTDKEVLPERDVVIEELRMRIEGNPAAQLVSEMNAALYGPHPYGRDIIGHKAEIEKLTTQDALDFYKRFYTPNNAVLIVAGDITGKELRPLAEKYYGVIARRAPTYELARVPVEFPTRPRAIEKRDGRVKEPMLLRTYPAPAYRQITARKGAALDVLAQILGGGTASRLYQSLVVKERVAASVSAGYDGSQYDAGDFAIYAMPRMGGDLKRVNDLILAELALMIRDGISSTELEGAKTLLMASSVYARDEQSAMAYNFGQGLMVGLSAKAIFEWPNHVHDVTAADVQAAAQEIFDESRVVTGTLLPAGAK